MIRCSAAIMRNDDGKVFSHLRDNSVILVLEVKHDVARVITQGGTVGWLYWTAPGWRHHNIWEEIT